MEFLEVTGITKKFGGLVVLRDVSFSVKSGQIVGVIGPNGAGKSTLFNLINGMIKPDSGKVFLEEHDITTMKPYEIAKLGISRTFQSVRPFMGYNVEENVRIGAIFTAKDTDQVDDRVEEALRLVGLLERKHESISSLTMQERKLVEVARALASKPRLLLLDEPMAGFNPVEIENFLRLVRRIRTTGTTVLIVEHVMKAIMGLSDKVVVLSAGTKIAEGRPEEIIKDPAVITAYLGENYDNT